MNLRKFAFTPSRKSLLILASYVAVMILSGLLAAIYFDRESLRATINSYGATGIVVFLLIQIIYVILVPIYNTPIHIAAGYIFGGYLGWLLNFVATSIALFLIILLVRRYGRPLLEKIVSRDALAKYDQIVEKIGPMALFVIYALPGFPDDEITYVMAAARNISLWRFLLPILIGNLSKTSTSFIGDEGMLGVGMALQSRIIVFVIGLIVVGIQEWAVSRKVVR